MPHDMDRITERKSHTVASPLQGALFTQQSATELLQLDALEQTVTAPPEWVRPAGFTGPCPECGSRTCPGYYKPDTSHGLVF